MSHGKLRKETNCLNCDAQVDGRYCKNCGQENLEPKQTLWHLITHFFNDVTHFDGKFFTTLKSLLLKPGFLTEEYVKGRRMKYLDPVRMYLFVSFAFFLLFLALNKPTERNSHNPIAIHAIDSALATKKGSTYMNFSNVNVHGENYYIFNFSERYSHGLHHYDSLQRRLPDSMRSEGFDRYMEERIIGVAEVYKKNPYDFMGDVSDKFRHSFSKVFFISLPIFSFILVLLYIRRRKEFFYVSHAIFSLHCYIVAWLLFAIGNIISYLLAKVDMANGDIYVYTYLGIAIYILIAMLRFYRQHWFKTIFKWLIHMTIITVVLFIIVFGLLLNSFFAMAGGH